MDTADQFNVTDLLATLADTSVGVDGASETSIGPLGAPAIVTAALAPAVLVATTENV